MIQFTPPKIWIWHAVQLGINTGRPIQRFQSVLVKTVQGIRKGLDESTDDYESTAAWKTLSDRFHKKRTLIY